MLPITSMCIVCVYCWQLLIIDTDKVLSHAISVNLSGVYMNDCFIFILRHFHMKCIYVYCKL